MNRKQRKQNRLNAARLHWNACVCPECGERGRHWITVPMTLQDMLAGLPDQGFWTCEKFYGGDGKRIPQGTPTRRKDYEWRGLADKPKGKS